MSIVDGSFNVKHFRFNAADIATATPVAHKEARHGKPLLTPYHHCLLIVCKTFYQNILCFYSHQLEDLFEVKKRETECIKSETTNPSALAKIYRSTFMLHEQDNGSMMGPLNVEHFRFDDADIAMVIPQHC